MRKLHILGIALAAIMSLLALAACVPFPFGGPAPGQQPYPSGPGSQQPYPYGPRGGFGPGMMGRGMGPGMMGGSWGDYYPNTNPGANAKPITIDQAADAVRGYMNAYYGGRLTLAEVMDFAWNYYAEVEEKDTGVHAMELLIDKYTGAVSPEMGPDMMWNTKYSPMGGMMGNYGGGPASMPVTPDQAKTLAQQYLDAGLPGLTVAEADTFYGYYTLHTLKDGKVEGMLSVNGYTGAVWYHSWHGPFNDMKEFE